jgi:modulator of FtsH protease
MYQLNRPRIGAVSSSALLGQVLGITAVGFLITAATAYFTQGAPYAMAMIAMLVGFGFLIAISATRANPSLSLLMFYAFTACEGVGLGPVIGRYVRGAGPEVVVDAAVTTGLGMLVLAGVVSVMSFDFRKLSGIAFALLIGLVIAGVISIFVHFLHPAIYAWATLAVFTLLVLVDFGRIRAGGDGATAIELATSIYLDAINIFMALLQIFGLRSRDD